MKTSELNREALNFAVAKALGHEVMLFDDLFIDNAKRKGVDINRVMEHLAWQHDQGKYIIVEVRNLQLDQMYFENLTPTRCAKEIPDYCGDWAKGGPILDLKKICVACPSTGDFWDARLHTFPPKYVRGPTALIAAMRCFVASELGDEIEIPEELT
jgi:hypothetical protein